MQYILLGGFATNINNLSEGYNFYTFNLNQFYNPITYFPIFSSNLFPFLNQLKLYAPDGQLEGFSYLGAGFICLFIFLIIYIAYKITFRKFNINKFVKNYISEIFILIIGFVVTLLISTGFKVTFGEKLLFTVNLSNSIFEYIYLVFRTPGRFIWIDCYLIYFLAFIFLLRIFSDKQATLILTVFLFFQVYDIYPALRIFHEEYYPKYVYNFHQKDLIDIIGKNKKVLITPRYSFLFDFYYYAIINNMKLTTLLYSRQPNDIDEYINERINNLEQEDLFVTHYNDDNILYIKNITKKFYCYNIDDLFIACTKNNIRELDNLLINN